MELFSEQVFQHVLLEIRHHIIVENMLREINEFFFKKHDCSWMLIGWLECYDQKSIAFLYIYSCGIAYLLIQFFTAEN